MRIRLGWCWVGLLVACASDPEASGLDSGVNDRGGADAASDAGADRDASSGADLGPNIGGDSGFDAGLLDAEPKDTGPDAGTGLDAGLDASVDTGPPADAGLDAGACPARVPAPDVDPWSVRLPSAGFGGTLTQSNGGHQDVLLKSPAPQLDYTRIGVRLDWGGTIVFWGLSASASTNTIDANDTGREVQIALYDPERNRQVCAMDASCLSSAASCGNSITFLGWNPVQGGDECNRGASTTWTTVGDALQVSVTPVQWNPDWDAPDCRTSACAGAARQAQVQYVMELRFVDPLVVELSLEVHSSETIDHGVTGQEFPTMYVAHGSGGPDLPVLLDAAGTPISIDQPANDGFTMKNFQSPAPWVSFQNNNQDYGVGLAMDQGLTGFQGWAGSGNGAPYFHNVRANIAFGLAQGATVRGRAYLALGAFNTIAASLGSVFARRPAFGSLDVPAAGTLTRGSTIPIAGWVLAPSGLNQVSVELDGAPLTTLPVNGARPDVCAVYPGYPGCPMVGFSGSIATAGLDACEHLLQVVAVTPSGVRTVLGERQIAN